MSYDLQALRLSPGEDVEAALEELGADEDRAPTSEERDRMERIAAALEAAVPSLDRVEIEDAIELSEEEDRVQVSIDAGEAAISIPYWFDGSEAQEVLALALRCAHVLRETGGFAVWDPQLDRLVDQDTVVAELEQAYAVGREQVRTLEQ